jgi:hypothetical protein
LAVGIIAVFGPVALHDVVDVGYAVCFVVDVVVQGDDLAESK